MTPDFFQPITSYMEGFIHDKLKKLNFPYFIDNINTLIIIVHFQLDKVKYVCFQNTTEQ